jgi:hypothetical protein
MNVSAQELLVPRPNALRTRVRQLLWGRTTRAGEVSDMDMIATTFDIAMFLSRLTRTLSIR